MLTMISGLLARGRSLWRALRGHAAIETDMAEEFRLHQELRAADLVRAGLAPAEAARRARLEFGSAERYKHEGRTARGLRPFDRIHISWLDLKLGFRMLVKYPGLTVVGGLAMAFAIWVGVVVFQLVSMFAHPTLPLPDGDRLVQIRNWDVAANRADSRALSDIIVWREGLRSVTDLGAFRDVERNLIIGTGAGEPVHLAEITASGFRIAHAVPLLGRPLVESDERAGAPPVVVIGHRVWQTRFGGASDVIGRTVRLGDRYATVVGIMPEGFAFPISHEIWTPLRPDVLEHAPGAGPGITVFGRLAPGVTREEAQAELTAFGQRAAAASPTTHEHLRPQLLPYTTVFYEPTGSELGMLVSVNVFIVLLLVLVCGNVALLLFARAAARDGELVVRSALGATRSRIVTQLFAEALVLGGAATVVGLAAAQLGLRLGLQFLELNLGRLPFWYEATLSPQAILYAGGLTLLGAAIAGVMPALKITRGLGLRLREGTAGGGGLRFGGVWTAVIVTQVAFTVAFPALVFVELRELIRARSYDVGFTAEEYLSMRLEMDAADVASADTAAARTAYQVRFGAALEELRRRMAAEPAIVGVTFVDRLPRMYHPERWAEVEALSPGAAQAAEASAGQAGGPVTTPPRYTGDVVSFASIDPSYFDVLETPILAGRGFRPVDLAPDARVVIVDQGFVDDVLQGRNAVGRRVRFTDSRRPDADSVADARPWYEIVGVVKDLGMRHPIQRDPTAGVYLPAAPGSTGPLYMIAHVRGDPLALGPRVRALATAVDPTLRLSELQRLDTIADEVLWVLKLWLRVTVALSAIALLLSLAGIYAVLAFTVARRTREIGVRVALGASRRRIVAAIFRRPLTQIGLGAALGGSLIAVAAFATPEIELPPRYVALLVAYAAFMVGVCLLACVVPTRRALRVEPTEALRADG
ncbi:MAG TPA: ABC transporter permease [Gemmatimonadaceae bacterium]|nr:ABC transporter permease [Gemmatimonadaceae bacterium]